MALPFFMSIEFMGGDVRMAVAYMEEEWEYSESENYRVMADTDGMGEGAIAVQVPSEWFEVMHKRGVAYLREWYTKRWLPASLFIEVIRQGEYEGYRWVRNHQGKLETKDALLVNGWGETY